MAARGFGLRLHTYGHHPDELRRALRTVLADAGLRRRMGDVATRLQSGRGTLAAAEAITRLAGG